MADRKYTIDIGTTGAQKAGSDVARVDSALSGMGKSALAAGAAMFASAGVIAGLRQVTEIAGRVTQVNKVEAAFAGMSAKAGLASNTLERLRQATRGAVSDFELMKSANNIMLLGVTKSTDQMAEMAEIARRLGSAVGLDAVSALDSLVIGLGRQSKLMLDNLGIVVDMDQAYRNYAASIGKSVDELTDAEKKIGFTNETMKKARELVSGLGGDSDETGDKLAQLAVEWENLKNSMDWVVGAATSTIESFNTIRSQVASLSDAISGSFVGSLWESWRVWNLNNVAVKESDGTFTQAISTHKNVAASTKEVTAAVEKSAETIAKEREARNALTDALALEINMKDGAWESTKALMESSGEWQDEAIAGLQDYTSGLFSTSDALETLGDSEDRVAQIQARRAAQKHQLTVQGIGDLAALNQAMKGNAEVTKRIMQVQAVIESSHAFTNTLSLASGLFPPPIPQILAGAALAAGLAQVAVIESQSFARGGVIEGAGGPMQDNVRINASAGESILNAQATARLGRDGVDSLNSGGGVGVTLVVQGNIIGEESWVRDNLLPQITATLRRRLA